MAGAIDSYKAGSELVSVLRKHGLQESVIQIVKDKVAQLLVEVGRKSSSTPQQQQQSQQQPVVLRDLQTAHASLPGLSCVTPKGKFDCGFFEDLIQLTNKQTSAQIPYSSIQHVLVIDCIPKQPGKTYVVLVTKSGQPVRQGKNALDLVVLQTADQPELDMPAPPACQHLGDRLTGPAAVVLSLLLATYLDGVDDSTFITADSNVFSSSTGDLMVAANKGVHPGWLVPLSVGLCYVGKPGSFMPRSTITKLLFHRTGTGSSTFDITIHLAGTAKPFELGQIDAGELPKLQAYCMKQRIRVGSEDDDDDEEQPAAAAAAAARGGAGAAGTSNAAAAAARDDDGDDDDDDEDDEDFDPDAAGQQKGTKRRRLAAAAPVQEDAGDDDGGDSDEDDDEDEDEAYGSGSGSESEPELLPSEELSGMEEDED